VESETIIDCPLTMPKIIVIGHLLFKVAVSHVLWDTM